MPYRGVDRRRYAALFMLALGLSAALYRSQTPVPVPVPVPVPNLIFLTANLPPLAVGDWVFRAGRSAESRLIQTLSKGEFSHIGMLVSLQPEPLIVHASTDDDPQRENQVLTSTLSDFIHPQRASSFAIARPRFVAAADHQHAAAWLLQQLGQPFVLADRQSAHLYCTTLLADALQQTQSAFQPAWQQINAPMFRGEYLFPSAFAEDANIEWLYRSSTRQQ